MILNVSDRSVWQNACGSPTCLCVENLLSPGSYPTAIITCIVVPHSILTAVSYSLVTLPSFHFLASSSKTGIRGLNVIFIRQLGVIGRISVHGLVQVFFIEKNCRGVVRSRSWETTEMRRRMSKFRSKGSSKARARWQPNGGDSNRHIIYKFEKIKS